DVIILAQADDEPGWQTLNIGWEDVFAVDGNSHLEEGADEGGICRLAARSVDGRYVDLEVVDDPFALCRLRRLCCGLNRVTHWLAPNLHLMRVEISDKSDLSD